MGNYLTFEKVEYVKIKIMINVQDLCGFGHYMTHVRKGMTVREFKDQYKDLIIGTAEEILFEKYGRHNEYDDLDLKLFSLTDNGMALLDDYRFLQNGEMINIICQDPHEEDEEGEDEGDEN